jgi:demethoxyubiquinone hydroxylase (CLK1/Coq7/Cat5 family)
MDPDATPRPTRRELLSGAIAGAGAASLALATLEVSDAAAAAATVSDADLVRTILSVELLGMFSYQQVLQSETISPAAAPVINHLLDHEQTHIEVMTEELLKLGQQPPAPPASVIAADAELAVLHGNGSLTSLHSEQDCLRLLEGVEQIAQGAYYTSLTKLRSPRLARICASILAAEGQHYTVLADLLHPGEIDKTVPGPFVEGRS